MEVDILAFGAHPDDIEIAAGGFILASIHSGLKVAIVDLTEGEMGTRGSASIRHAEATKAASIMGVPYRENLHLPDSALENSQDAKKRVIRMIRKYKPKILLSNGMPPSRHPDHGVAWCIVQDASFLAGLKNISTQEQGQEQTPHRPAYVFSYLENTRTIAPSFIFDITPFFEKKIEVIKSYASQFYNPNSKEPETMLTKPGIFNTMESINRFYGQAIGVKYGEPFTSKKTMGINSLDSLVKIPI
ncbi:MAG: bacillithiol biosynthesis deacetylase BshB1 [Phycisphaerales bacterium]|nr:bacillithiol biosynthesis deacetylase BshB1 [Phycisphaerales bacterium]